MPRESYNVRRLKAKSLSSFRAAVVAFNGLGEDGRVTSVLLDLQHAFEMLLKAALEAKKVQVFDKRSEKSISLETAIRLCQQTDGIKITDEEAGTIRAVDALRDAEQHWLVTVDESMLYLFVRAGVTLFDDLLTRVFGSPLAEHLPARVLPISAEPPQDLHLLVDREYERIAQLLKPGRRATGEAYARIRTLLATEALTDPDAAEVREGDVRRVERGIRAGKGREKVFPKLGTVSTSMGGTGLSVEVRWVKTGGLPVTFSSGGGETEPASIRLVDLEKKFYLTGYDLADKVTVTRNKATALRRHLGLDANDDHYSHEFKFGSVRHMRYSDNALRRMKEALPEIDMERVWESHRTIPQNRKSREQPPCDQPGCVMSSDAQDRPSQSKGKRT